MSEVYQQVTEIIRLVYKLKGKVLGSIKKTIAFLETGSGVCSAFPTVFVTGVLAESPPQAPKKAAKTAAKSTRFIVLYVC